MWNHYGDVIMGTIASQITSLTIVYSTVYSGADQRKHQSSASLAFVRGIHRWPVNSPHKWPVTRKMFPLDDVIMTNDISFSRHDLIQFQYDVPVAVKWLSRAQRERWILKHFRPWQQIRNPRWRLGIKRSQRIITQHLKARFGVEHCWLWTCRLELKCSGFIRKSNLTVLERVRILMLWQFEN